MPTRRDCIRGLVAALGTISTRAYATGPSCFPLKDSGSLIIDVHCHLLNARDVNREAFVHRRILNANKSLSPALLATPFGYMLTGLTALGGTGMSSEQSALRDRLRQWARDDEGVCRYLEDLNAPTTAIPGENPNQRANIDAPTDWYAAFRRSRLGNASALARLYASVDIFTPSIVDMYEGDYRRASDPETMTVLFERIAVASRGRMVPMVCFNPMREIHWRSNSRKDKANAGLGPLQNVRRAVLDMGFVGVKVHPSVGFAPLSNKDRSCPNEVWKNPKWIDGFRKLHGTELDDALSDLYEFCRDQDVPILTHGSPGIPAFAECMKSPADEPLKWLNAPLQWKEVQDLFDTPSRKLTVCIGHFAGALSGSPYFPAWIESLGPALAASPRLFLDLSYQGMLLDGSSDLGRRKLRMLFDWCPALKTQTVYGSDWHMIAKEKDANLYVERVSAAIPDDSRAKVMGANAVELLGLRQGRGNRDRLDAYYARQVKRSHLPLGFRPAWQAKVDARTL